MKTPRRPLAALIFLLGAVSACSHEPRLKLDVANRHRAIVSSDVVDPRSEHDIEGDVGGETKSLEKWSRKAPPGSTIEVKLDPGVYVIDDTITVKGVSLVIAGSGVDKTRIKLSSSDWRSLTVSECPSFELRGVTVAAYTGGGINIERCPRVVINECDFVGARYGLELEDSNAIIDSCVFAGDERALIVKGGSTLLRGTSICDNWWAIQGSTKLSMLGCVIMQNEKGSDITCTPGSVIRSLLLGHNENWRGGGSPVFESSLLGSEDVVARYTRMGGDSNRTIDDIANFPTSLPYGFPPRCDVGAIHYALERFRQRGKSHVLARVDDLLRPEAERYADGARRAAKAKNAAVTRELATLAWSYVLALSTAEARAPFHDIETLASTSP